MGQAINIQKKMFLLLSSYCYFEGKGEGRVLVNWICAFY